MSLGFFAPIVFVVTVFCLIKRKYLLYAVIFFAPFQTCSVVVLGEFSLQPGHYFLALLVIYTAIRIVVKNEIIVFPSGFLAAFIAWALLSIFLADIFNINEPVYGIGNGVELKSSLVSIQNFTQYLYLLSGFLTYWIIYAYCVSSNVKWESLVRVALVSGAAVILIGIYQFVALNWNLPYDEFFGNPASGRWQTLERAQSTMQEASFLGQYCIYVMVLTVAWGGNAFIKSRYRNILICCILVVGVLSRSTTFLIGLFSILACYFLVCLLFGTRQKKWKSENIIKVIIGIMIFAGLALYLWLANTYFQQLINSAIDKFNSESVSAIERSSVFSYMFNIGLNYPIFGIGYGGGRSTDLYANIFSTTGLVGLFLFLSFFITRGYVAFTHRSEKGFWICILFIVGFATTSISIPDLTNLPVWVFIAILDARCAFVRRSLPQASRRS